MQWENATIIRLTFTLLDSVRILLARAAAGASQPEVQHTIMSTNSCVVHNTHLLLSEHLHFPDYVHYKVTYTHIHIHACMHRQKDEFTHINDHLIFRYMQICAQKVANTSEILLKVQYIFLLDVRNHLNKSRRETNE